MNILRIDLLEIAKKAWLRGAQSPKAFNCEQASTIRGFKSHLNQIRTELNGKSGPIRSESNQILEHIEIKSL